MCVVRKALFSVSISLFIAGCTLIELDRLVPAAVVADASGSPIGIVACDSANSPPAQEISDKFSAILATTHTNVRLIQSTLPVELTRDPVVRSVLGNVKHLSSSSIANAHLLLHGRMTKEDVDYVASSPKPPPIGPTDVMAFTHTVAEYTLRHTISAPNDEPAQAPFWTHLKAYYSEYYQGQFVSYFGRNPADRPRASLTIDDAEIVQAAGVFLELLFDEALQPTVWQGDDGKYYPGGGTKAPTYLTVNNMPPVSIKKHPKNGCGMNVDKAVTLNYLAQSFATAATGEASLAVKTAGGLQVGLGILGKVNIGDNNTLTALLQSVVSQTVKRLTVVIAAPILEAIDLEPEAEPAGAVRFATARLGGTSKLNRAEMIRRYSAPFVSATSRFP